MQKQLAMIATVETKRHQQMESQMSLALARG